MTLRIFGSTCAAAMLAVTVAAAQGSTQAPTQAPAQGNSEQRPVDRNNPGTARTQTDQQITITGCVSREGASDFVLTSAAATGASGNVSAGVPGSTSTGAVGTSGSASAQSAPATKYRLSGERDLVEYVGQRVEIVGRTDAKAGSTAAGASAGSAGVGTTGSATAAPAAGVEASSGASDANRTAPPAAGSTAGAAAATSTPMQHVTITSVRALGGSCL